jgi:hypothetical protein
MTTKYEINSRINKFGTFSFRHELEHQKRVKKSCECNCECNDKKENDNEKCHDDDNIHFCISDVYQNDLDAIPLKSELNEPKMKTIVNLVLNKQRLNKIINKKEW